MIGSWKASVNVAMNLWVPKNKWILWPAVQGRHCAMEFFSCNLHWPNGIYVPWYVFV